MRATARVEPPTLRVFLFFASPIGYGKGGDRTMHPAVKTFIEAFEKESRERYLVQRTLGRYQTAFLESVLGPALHWNFEGVRVEYPFRDVKGGDRFADIFIERGPMKLVIELDDYASHVKISQGVFADHLFRQNSLVLRGVMVLRFANWQIEHKPEACRAIVEQALGHWWSLLQAERGHDPASMWTARRERVVRIAVQNGGVIRTADLVQWFEIPRRTAYEWLQRFVDEGVLEAEQRGLRISRYKLKHR
jgi:very-short-patch-repair endonuclease